MNTELLSISAPKSSKNVNLDKDALFAVGAEMVKNGCALIRECGGKADPVEQLCAVTGISKRLLAGAMVLAGHTASEISEKLQVSRTTIYVTWPEVGRTLKAKHCIEDNTSKKNNDENDDFFDE